MTYIPKPATRPENPRFSSGPCAKIPGWTPGFLNNAFLGRSHRAADGKARLKLAIDLTGSLLQLPDDYLIGIVPASDTGAVEMALWSLLGPRGVDMLAWERFGRDWIIDVSKQLKLDDVRQIVADYGELPDLSLADTRNRDCVFAWNGTTSGARVPNADWIASDREGLIICDATSAAFAQPIEWAKIDVATFSWQKVLGGEAAHGMLILSPRAVRRLESYEPAWPLPKIFRLTKAGKLNASIFEGATINTPSMMCVEDYIASLRWAKSIGGLDELIARADANAAVIDGWVKKTDWIEHLVVNPAARSNTSVCLRLSDAASQVLGEEKVARLPKQMAVLLEEQGVAFDINNHRDAPPGLRIWCGVTVATTDLEALMPWLDWAYDCLR